MTERPLPQERTGELTTGEIPGITGPMRQDTLARGGELVLPLFDPSPRANEVVIPVAHPIVGNSDDLLGQLNDDTGLISGGFTRQLPEPDRSRARNSTPEIW